MLNQPHLKPPERSMGEGIAIRYGGRFAVSEHSIQPTDFKFTPELVAETFADRETHLEALRKYRIQCDDFLLVTGTVNVPERIFLVKRAEEPLKGALWPLGGRAVNCPSSDSPLATLWRENPLYASLFLSIYRECSLQPADIQEVRELGTFHIVFQNHSGSVLFNRDHPATLHAVWTKPSMTSKMDLTGARISDGDWYTSEQINQLHDQGVLLDHVKQAADAIFKIKPVQTQFDLADFQI